MGRKMQLLARYAVLVVALGCLFPVSFDFSQCDAWCALWRSAQWICLHAKARACQREVREARQLLSAIAVARETANAIQRTRFERLAARRRDRDALAERLRSARSTFDEIENLLSGGSIDVLPVRGMPYPRWLVERDKADYTERCDALALQIADLDESIDFTEAAIIETNCYLRDIDVWLNERRCELDLRLARCEKLDIERCLADILPADDFERSMDRLDEMLGEVAVKAASPRRQ